MAVVNLKSSLFRDEHAGGAIPDPAFAGGRTYNLIGRVANAADDSNTSDYLLARIPSRCVLLPETVFHVANWGFAQVVIGLRGDTDALLDVAKTAATTQSPIAATDAAFAKPAWERLGVTAYPGEWLDLYVTAEAGAAGAGDMEFRIAFSL